MQSVIKLSEATAIALHSMIYICNKDKETSSVKEIAQQFKISDNHLSKVLQRLVKAGYLLSSKGPKGGFVINEQYKDASFLEIYEIIEGKMSDSTCLFNRQPCQGGQCILGDFVIKINQEFREYFTQKKISDFRK
ncbi:MAG: Rrf2 family transcriptional regulator [bacterium]